SSPLRGSTNSSLLSSPSSGFSFSLMRSSSSQLSSLLSTRDACLKCVSLLARGLGRAIHHQMNLFLNKMIACGLCEQLIETLTTVARFIPELLPSIQAQLLNLSSAILAHDTNNRFIDLHTTASSSSS